jgi:hypothetical protein
MSDSELSELVERLDQLVPRDRAKLRILGDADGNATHGTLDGYRRLGVELLRATLSPVPQTESQPARLLLDIDYLLIGDEESPLGLCEIHEALEERPAPERNRLDPVAQLLAALVVVVLLVLILIGASAVLGWILG